MKGPPAERADPREGGKSRSATDSAATPRAAGGITLTPLRQRCSRERSLSLLRTTDAPGGPVAQNHGLFCGLGASRVWQLRLCPPAPRLLSTVGQGVARFGMVN